MLYCKKLNRFISYLICCFIFLSAIILPKNSHAIYEGTRSGIKYNSQTTCNTGTIEFDPFTSNRDLSWDLSNQTCLAYITTVGSLLAAQSVLSYFYLCKITPTNTPANARIAQDEAKKAKDFIGPPLPPYPNPGYLVRAASLITSCALFATDVSVATAACVPVAPATVPNNPYFCGGLVSAGADQTRCCAGAVAFSATLAASVAALAIIYDTAKITYENARICGHDWQEWTQDENGLIVKDKGAYRICLENMFLKGSTTSYCKNYDPDEGSFVDQITEGFDAAAGAIAKAGTDAADTLSFQYASVDDPDKVDFDDQDTGIGDEPSDYIASIKNKYYREFIYGGKEFSDNGEGSCQNPWSKSEREERLGYSSGDQRYYMTGSGSAPVFACHRFLANDLSDESRKAYECCKRRSQRSICIENKAGLGEIQGNYEHRFCEIGSKCTVGNVIFSTYESKVQSNYICSSTYSVCPYNHLLGGGTEEGKYYSVASGKIGQMENYCQFMKHCSKIPILPSFRTSNLEGAFISASCRDMVGDSQNSYNYNGGLIPISGRNFTAPMAQCFKETVENLFLNKAGRTECIDANETPGKNDVCTSGYKFRKGYELPTESIFSNIQKRLQGFIKMGLVLSITAFGYATLMAVPGNVIERKKLVPYVLKIALVMYFAVGNGWKDGFVEGVLGASGFLSEMVFKIDEDKPANKLDGCQFPRVNYADDNEDTKYDEPAYATQNQYLRIWDTFDCKITRALGYGADVSVPNLIFMILGGLFTGGLGVVFFVASFFFAFVILSVAIRALHIFLMSTTAVIILLYVSPIMITLVMFERTKGIFEKWWKQILGFTLQPMILFAYLGILVTLMDKVLIGDDVVFVGDGKKEPKQISCNGDANETSLYCIFKINDIKTYNGFEALGIGLPMLANMNQAKMQTIIKAAIIMTIFMKFLEQISGLAEKLVGGSTLKSDWGKSAGEMAGKAYKGLRAVQKRGSAAIKKHGMSAAKAARDGAKSYGSSIGNKGKSTGGVESPTDSVASSGGKDGAGSTGEGGPKDNTGGSGGGSDSSKSSPKNEDS
jgi:hypothetical protein